MNTFFRYENKKKNTLFKVLTHELALFYIFHSFFFVEFGLIFFYLLDILCCWLYLQLPYLIFLLFLVNRIPLLLIWYQLHHGAMVIKGIFIFFKFLFFFVVFVYMFFFFVFVVFLVCCCTSKF